MRERVARMSAHVSAVRARVVSHPHLAILAVLGLAVLMTGLALRHVGQRRTVVRLGYELSTATAELRRLDQEERRLRLEKSVLTNPARIEHLATELGMVRPTPEQVRLVWRAPTALVPPSDPASGKEER